MAGSETRSDRSGRQIADDLDGSPNASLKRFSLDGQEYEVYLSPANAARLDESLEAFVTAARLLDAPRRRR